MFARISCAALLYGLFIADTCPAQALTSPLRFQHLTVEDGLPENSVRVILQDRLGFMWFGTQRGLVRYDGYTLKPYSTITSVVYALHEDRTGNLWIGTRNDGLIRLDRATETTTSFHFDTDDNNAIGFIHEDRDGDIWVLTDEGHTLFRMEPRSGTITPYQHDPENPNSLGKGRMYDYGLGQIYPAFCEDRDGLFWIGTQGGGLSRLDKKTGMVTRFMPDSEDPGSLSHHNVQSIYKDADGELWIGTSGGLDRWNRETETFDHFRHNPEVPNSLSSNVVQVVFGDALGHLWIGTWGGGLNRFDPPSQTFTAFKHDPADPNTPSGDFIRPMPLLADQKGGIWFASASGVIDYFDPETETFTHFREDQNDASSLKFGNRVESIYQDRSGVFWFGTWLAGVNILDRSGQKFTYIQHDPASEQGLRSNEIASVYEDREGILWIGTTGGGLHRLDRRTGKMTHYQHDPADPYSISHNNIAGLLEDSQGTFWVGTWGGGLNVMDRRTGRFTRYQPDPADPYSMGGRSAVVILEDAEGQIWVGTRGNEGGHTGLQKFDRATGRFIHYHHASKRTQADGVFALYQDSQKRLWVGTNVTGFLQFDLNTEQFITHPHLLEGAAVYAFHEDSKGRLWIGSFIRGLGLFDPETGASKMYTEADGLSNNTIFDIREDDQGRLWMSTRNGLSRFDPATEQFRTYTRGDGLPGNTFIQGPGYKNTNGEMFLGTDQGLVLFHPDRLSEDPYGPPVVLTRFNLDNQPVQVGPDSPLQTHISVASSIELVHDQNDFSFEFTGLNYSRPEKTQYAFMLDNYDVTWRAPGRQRTATYTNMDPGDYVFRVKAANADGVWSETGTALSITIRPPWWRTTWAYLLYGLLFLTGIFVVDRVQRRRLIRAEQEKARIREAQLKAEAAEEHARVLEELDHLKSRFFANISHEFRTPLTLLMGPLQDALEEENTRSLQDQLPAMQRNGRRLLRLINQLLDLSKLEAGQMTLRARKADAVPLVRAAAQAFESMAQRKQVALDIETPNAVDLYYEPDKLEKILYNLLSNAFKFTPAGGTVRVVLEDDDEQVEIRVQDTGVGIDTKNLPYIFDRFIQVDGSSTRDQEGTGIGLALTKELVALHGGSIQVESTLGTGTTFFIRLPKGRAHLSDEEIDDGSADDEPPGATDPVIEGFETAMQAVEAMLEAEADARALKILVVEDNIDVRTYLKRHLVPRYRVLEASNGLEGLETARIEQPALVISDVMMPKMDGYELCRAVKSDEDLSHIPVVLLTARADEESKVEGLETGADDYLYKPFNATELQVRVENLIEIRRLLRNRFSKTVQAVAPGEIELTSSDDAFLKQVQDVVETHMADSNFGVDWLAGEVALSPRQLGRKLQALTGLSGGGYIRSMRLQRAAQMLEQGAGTVSETAYAVGFQKVSHFSKLFQQVFGVIPSKYPPTES